MSVGKHSKHWRPLHDLWSYNGDGQFTAERIKGKDKQVLRRKTRHRFRLDREDGGGSRA